MNDAKRYFELGLDYLNRDDLKGALPHLREAVKLNPQEAEYRLRLGELLLSLNRPDSAVIQFKEGVNLSPANRQIRVLLGQAFLSMEKLNEAEAEFQEALRLNSEEGLAIAGIADVQFKRGNLDDAIVRYQEANKLAPKNSALLWGLANAFIQKKDYEPARKALNAVVRCGGNESHIKSAKELLNKIAGKEPPPRKNEDAEVIFQLSRNLVSEGKIEDAAIKLRKAIRLDSRDPEYRVEYGLTQAELGNFEEAEAQLRKSVRLGTDDVRAYVKLGEIYLNTGMNEKALLSLERAKSLDGENQRVKDLLNQANQTHVLEAGRESALFILFVKSHLPEIWGEYRKREDLKQEEFRKVKLEGQADAEQIDATVKILTRKGLVDYARYEGTKFLIKLRALWTELIRAVCYEIPPERREAAIVLIPRLKSLHKDFTIERDSLITKGQRKTVGRDKREKLERRLAEVMPSCISDEGLSDAVLLSLLSFNRDKDSDNIFLSACADSDPH